MGARLSRLLVSLSFLGAWCCGCAAPTGPSTAANCGSTSPRTYTVRMGDTLWEIAVKFYGDGVRWEDILAANPNIKDPARDVRSGMRIVIP